MEKFREFINLRKLAQMRHQIQHTKPASKIARTSGFPSAKLLIILRILRTFPLTSQMIERAINELNEKKGSTEGQEIHAFWGDIKHQRQEEKNVRENQGGHGREI